MEEEIMAIMTEGGQSSRGEKRIFLCSGAGSNPWLTAHCCQLVPGVEPITTGITQLVSFLGCQPPLVIYIQLSRPFFFFFKTPS